MSNFRIWKMFFFVRSNQVKHALIFPENQTQQRKPPRNGRQVDFSVFGTRKTSADESKTKLESVPPTPPALSATTHEEETKRDDRKDRNEICTEIEKATIVNGNSLHRLHNNLKVTKTLEKKGLMFWTIVKMITKNGKNDFTETCQELAGAGGWNFWNEVMKISWRFQSKGPKYLDPTLCYCV